MLSMPVELGFYVHIRNHTALFFDTGLAYRYTYAAGFHLDTKLTMGGMLSFPGAPLYQVQEGAVTDISGKAWPKFMPAFGLGCGFDCRPAGVPMDLNIGLQVFGEYPFNSFLLPHPAAVLSVGYFPFSGGEQ